MQSIRWTMRTVGEVDGAISPQDFAEYVEYQYLSDGYEIWKQVETPVYSENGKNVVAMKFWLTLTKNVEEVSAKKK